MSQSSSNSEQQPESPQPRIDQRSSGNSVGGQQAASGDGNFQYQDNSTTNNIYLDLQDEDLEPLSLWGKVLTYFKVFIFLVIILIFWVFFGIFTNFPFPYGQAIDLMLCCFKGTVASKVNRLQKRLQQSENIGSQPIQKLNNCDFQVRLYLGIFKYLGVDKAESHERLAKTIESLKQKKSELQDEIKPRQPKKYQIVTRIQDFFEFINLSGAERDLIQIESILNEVTWAIRTNYPSETIVQDTINRLSRKTTGRADKISPFRIGILYSIEALLREVSDKEISNLGESELNELNRKIRSDLKEQKDTFSGILNELRKENQIAQQELRDYSDEIDKLNDILAERESDLSDLRGYAETNQSQQIEINTLDLKLTRVNEELRKLQAQKTSLSEQINFLNQEVHQKQARIDKLINQLSQYSRIRTLEGKYIGNLSDKTSKYHFDRKCDAWKMLVGEYMLHLDVSRKIASSDTPTLFIRAGLRECEKCAKKRTKNRRA